MNYHHLSAAKEEAHGQATFEMANLRPKTTGLPFVVFISQKNGAQHDIRVKVAEGPKVRPSDMSCYALRPFRRVEGDALSAAYEHMLEVWCTINLTTLVGYWDGEIEYTEDAIDILVRVNAAAV